MKNNEWFTNEKSKFLKKERKDLFSKKKEKKSKDDFTKQTMKTAIALPVIAGGILIGTKLLSEIGDL